MKTQESWMNYNMLQPNMGYNVGDRCPRAHARANIYFFNVRSSATHCYRTRSHFRIFLGSHPSLDILAWRYKAMAFKIVSKSGLSKIFCIARGIMCDLDGVMRPTLFTRPKDLFKRKTLPRLHYLLPRSCQLFSSRQQPVWDASCAEG